MITVGWIERAKAQRLVIEYPPWYQRPLRPQTIVIGPGETVLHWRNEAAKRKCGGDMSKANSKQLVRVATKRGVSASLMRTLKSKNYRRAA